MSFAAEVKAQLCRAEVKSSQTAAAELLGLSFGKKDYPERRLFLEKKAGDCVVSLEELEGETARAFIRGCFISCGTVNNPSKSVHLEIRFADDTEMRLCRETMIMSGFAPRVSTRRDYLILYMKKTEMIVEFLGFLGAYKAVLEFESVNVAKEYNSNVNRTMNCDLANIDKAIAAGQKQVDLINRLKATGNFYTLPESVRAVAELRLENPEASLETLGKMLNPPLSKSGVAHRLRQLKE